MWGKGYGAVKGPKDTLWFKTLPYAGTRKTFRAFGKVREHKSVCSKQQRNKFSTYCVAVRISSKNGCSQTFLIGREPCIPHCSQALLLGAARSEKNKSIYILYAGYVNRQNHPFCH